VDAPISVIAHSAAVAAFQKFENQWPEQISDMVMLAGSPLKTAGDVVPAVPKQLRFVKYLWKLYRNKQFRLSAEDERFVRSGIAVNFGVESGLVTKQILFQLESVEPIQCPSLVLAAMHDQFYPLSKGIQEAIAYYNGSVYAEVNGSHMFHCDPTSAAETAQYIRAWRSSLKSEPQHRRKVAA
jgi:pimeloyl-ACP methyl ester carboxylesterase